MDKIIYARNTIIDFVDNDTADDFIKQWHRQGLVTFGKMRRNVGLYSDGVLVGLASFSSPRTKAKRKDYEQELVRMVFPDNVRVVGGASRMIQFFLKSVSPKNMFTYQRGDGELTDVYSASGMVLVEKARDKKVLVSNGYDYKSALKSGVKYAIINAQLMRLGPDRLLGTALGERYDETDRRFTNRELFIEYCDYHEETIAGDNVYEWNNPDFIHYVYKIESSNPDDHYYYIGRHSERNGSWDQLDSYLGSGGRRFKDWVELQTSNGYSLVKTVLSKEDSWRKLLIAEKRIVKTHLNEPGCLNMAEGGAGFSDDMFDLENCEKHGRVIHRYGVCEKCKQQSYVSEGECAVHDRAVFRLGGCSRCISSKAIRVETCSVHGESTFNGKACFKCQWSAISSIKNCDEHGDVFHVGYSCCKCAATKSSVVRECAVHGLTKFKGDACMACAIGERSKVAHLECTVHGLTPHRGSTCLKCSTVASIELKECPIHGLSKHKGNACFKCTVGESNKRRVKKSKTTVYQDCDNCGPNARHVNNQCMRCKDLRAYKELECQVHGLSKHRGRKCCLCEADKRKEKRKLSKMKK